MECERCGDDKPDEQVKSVQVSAGRDNPGVGGAMCPPEYAPLCEECREEIKAENAEQVKAERQAEADGVFDPEEPPIEGVDF